MSTTRKESERPAPERKPYRSPRLTVHGDLRTLTKMMGAKGGNKNDGGGLPKTRL